jgi:phosphoglycolate phosphatase-like HAD superfamily hydrolase
VTVTRPLTVLFDLDGTIVDSIELLTASMGTRSRGGPFVRR